MPRKSKKYNERIEIGRGPDGKRIRKWIRADTKAELEALRRQAYRETEQARNPSAITLGEYAQVWFDTYKGTASSRTKSMYRTSMNKLAPISGIQLRKVTATDFQQRLNAYWEHPRTCSLLRMTIRQIYRQAIKDGIVHLLDITDDLKIPKRLKRETRFITDDEMEIILGIDFLPEDRMFIDVARYTGMRPAEILALDWKNVDFDAKVIHVVQAMDLDHSNRRVKSTKTGVTRDIPLNSCLASVLASERQDSGFLFLTPRAGEMYSGNDYNNLQHRLLAKIRKTTGAPDIVVYSFRHTFANFLYYKGVCTGKISTKKAAQIMGHSEQMFLDVYTHVDDSQESVAEILEQL